MNVLQVLPELNVGGVETGTLDLSKHLVKLGHKAVVVSGGGGLVKNLEALGAIHYELPVHKKSFFSIIKTIPLLAEIIKKEQIDIVHARSRVPAWIAFFACRRTQRPMITTCHGYYAKHLFSRAMGWGKFVICPSQIIAKHMIEDFGVPLEKIQLVPRGVDMEKFTFIPPDKKEKKAFHIGMIGRITPIKGHTYFLKAIAKLVRKVNNIPIKVWIVGDASERYQGYKYELELLVKRLGLKEVVEFLGTQRDMPAIMNQLNLSVSATTIHEPFPRVIIESYAAGVPVVATKMGGVVDMVDDGVTGLLVAPQDADGLAEAMLEIIQDNTLACRLAKAGFEKVKSRFTLQIMVDKTLEVYQKALSNFNILVIKLSALGDAVLIAPSLRALRKKFPKEKYKIHLLINTPYQEIFLNSPYVDELIVCSIKGEKFSSLWRLGEKLKKKNFDLVIDFQNNRASHILSYLSGAANRYGYNNKKFGFLLNYGIKDEKMAIDPVAHQFRVLKILDIELTDPHLELWPTKEDQQYVDEFLNAEWLSANQKLIGINVSASPKWVTKSWPKEHMARLCEELVRRDLRVVITGTEQDLAYANELMSLAKNVKIINACGRTTFNQLACLIKKCSVFISADSSPLHVAVAMDTPVVALFGPTDPARHMPPAKEYAIIKKDFSCSPCYKPKCKTKKCMEAITPEEVLGAVEKFLK